MLDPVYNFCITHGLLDSASVEFLVAFQERPPLDPLEAVLDHGVDETVLYRLAANELAIKLLDPEEWEQDPDAGLIPRYQAYFGTIALRRRKFPQLPEQEAIMAASDKVYATAAFTGLERLRGVLCNMLGKEQPVALLTLSHYKVFAKELGFRIDRES